MSVQSDNKNRGDVEVSCAPHPAGVVINVSVSSFQRVISILIEIFTVFVYTPADLLAVGL